MHLITINLRKSVECFVMITGWWSLRGLLENFNDLEFHHKTLNTHTEYMDCLDVDTSDPKSRTGEKQLESCSFVCFFALIQTRFGISLVALK